VKDFSPFCGLSGKMLLAVGSEVGENAMKLIDGFDSNYRYILVAARRARQLQGGAPPVIDTHSRKPCRIAQDEIKAGKVKWVIPEVAPPAIEVAAELLDKAVGQEN